MFIAFEGLDGSGSSTQSKLLAEHFEQKGKAVVHTKEPTTGTIGKLVRAYLQHKHETSAKALQLLFAADREDHLHKIVRPAINNGKVVITDRYLYSSIAYGAIPCHSREGGNPELNNRKSCKLEILKQVQDDKIKYLESLYTDFLKPDIVFLLKVPAKECVKRIESRGSEKELFEKEEYLEAVWKNYELLAKKHGFIKIIDGTLEINEVQQEILRYL